MTLPWCGRMVIPASKGKVACEILMRFSPLWLSFLLTRSPASLNLSHFPLQHYEWSSVCMNVCSNNFVVHNTWPSYSIVNSSDKKNKDWHKEWIRFNDGYTQYPTIMEMWKKTSWPIISHFLGTSCSGQWSKVRKESWYVWRQLSLGHFPSY